MLLELSSPFAEASKKPRNYRERLTYVNLETAGPSLSIEYSTHCQHFNFGASC